MKNKLFYPDYNHSILGIPNSLLRHYGAKINHPALPILDKYLKRDYKNVILIILDGMGIDMLQHNLSKFSFLRRHIKSKISSVFPSTTVAATTAYYSGLAPIEHGWLGWAPYFKDLDRVVELYTNKDFYTGKKQRKNVTQKMSYPHICDKISCANHTVNCTKIFPTFVDPDGPSDFNEFCFKIKQISQKKGSQFVLAYWSDPDHTSHEFGPYSKNVKMVLKNINSQIKSLCTKLKDALVIVSADHGHIATRDIFLNDYPEIMDCLLKPLSLDMRAQTVFLKPNKKKSFVRLFDQFLAKDFLLIKTQEALKMNLFGLGKSHPFVQDFLGDYLIIAKGEKNLVQRFPNDCYHVLKGSHFSLTTKEMLVPLILIKK